MPPNHTIITILRDYLKYLKDAAGDYIQATHADGNNIWKETQNNIVYVLRLVNFLLLAEPL